MTEYTLLQTLAGLPRTTRGKPIVLHADPKGKNYLYCIGSSVVIRDFENPAESDVYTQHAKDTTVAAYAPSGFYICSADVTGKVRIWDTTQKEHILKYEYTSLGGAIKDIAWTEDSKRIAVCGEGKENYANVFMWDTGTSVGNLGGSSKACNNVDIKQTRPYRLVLSSEDFSSYFYEGPPFKIKKQQDGHTSFVNCCRFSPDGSKYATAGADGKCFIYDGKTGDLLGELCEPAGRIHKGGVYGLSWSPDGKQLMTCSADKSVKIWNIDDNCYTSNKEDIVFQFPNSVDDMQVGCLWSGDNLISVSLRGDINYLDKDNPAQPKRIVKGHNKGLVSSCLNEDKSVLFTGSFDGLICGWGLSSGIAESIAGKKHENQVQAMSCSGDVLTTCGMDDTVRFISISEMKYKDEVLKLDSQPKSIASGAIGMSVVACLSEVVVIQDMKITHKYKTEYENTAIAISSSLGKVVVGTNESKVMVYDIEGDQLKLSGSFPTSDVVTDVKFSPDNQYVAATSAKKQVKIVCTSDFKTEKASWTVHAVRVNAVAWTPDSRHVASSGTDGTVYTYDVESESKQVTIRGAHSQAVDVTSVQWSNDNTLITIGKQDCSVRLWQIKH